MSLTKTTRASTSCEYRGLVLQSYLGVLLSYRKEADGSPYTRCPFVIGCGAPLESDNQFPPGWLRDSRTVSPIIFKQHLQEELGAVPVTDLTGTEYVSKDTPSYRTGTSQKPDSI